MPTGGGSNGGRVGETKPGVRGDGGGCASRVCERYCAGGRAEQYLSYTLRLDRRRSRDTAAARRWGPRCDFVEPREWEGVESRTCKM